MLQFRTRVIAATVSLGALTYASDAVAQQQQRAQTTPTPQAPAATTTPPQKDSLLGPDWKLTAGLGVMGTTEYLGSDNYKATPLPIFDLTWRNALFVSTTEGVGGYVFNNETYKLGAAVNMSRGRNTGDDDHLKGMRSIGTAAEVKVFGSYNFGAIELKGDVRQRIGPVNGLLATAGVNYRMSFSPKLFLSVGPSVTWGDESITNGFFGVTATEAANARYAGNYMTAYKAGSGFRDVSLNMMGRYQWTDSWSIGMMAKLTELVGDAADSPLTHQKLQPSAGLFVAYKF